MTDLPAALSPLGQNGAPPALAYGPFVVQITDPEGVLYSVGCALTQADENAVVWMGLTEHQVHPDQTPLIGSNGTISFTQAADGTQYLIRPLDPGDGVIAGDPDLSASDADPSTAQAVIQALATVIWGQFYGNPGDAQVGENNLYVTRSQSGEPLALIKMLSSSPTLLRQNGGWRLLGDDEDDLLGDVDIPVRAGAVLAWDSGDLRGINRFVSDDRFAPSDAIELWVELDETNHVQRLLLRRSRNRVYARTNGRWALATPDPDAATVDVMWSAIGAWDDGDLQQLAQVQPYDVDGEAA